MKIQNFFKTANGQTAKLYSLTNKKGFRADITDMGGALVSIFTPDRTGKQIDVLMKYNNPADFEPSPAFYGALVGRVANRIANGHLVVEGKEYKLPINDGNNRPNTLHGGLSYARRLWNAKVVDDATLNLTLTSPDGDAGFPGRVDVSVVYHLTEENEIEISYRAVSDKTTVVNLTNHAYFNLNGGNTQDCLNHIVTSKAYARTEVDKNLAPTGRSIPVKGTAFDLSVGRTFNEIMNDKTLEYPFDDNFILAEKAGNMQKNVFHVVSPETGITLEVDTDQPGVQFYMKPVTDAQNNTIALSAFCLEAQLWPDAPNHPDFPSAILKPGDVYMQKTVYRFGIE